MIEALKRVRAERVALLTPYGYEFHQKFLPFLKQADIHVATDGVFDCKTDIESVSCRLRRFSTLPRCSSTGRRRTRSLYPALPCRSCSNSHVFEAELGIRVMCSTQAMARHALKLVGYKKAINGFGKLLDAPRV
ncbi:hypothetical protein LCM4579_27715 [Ensifer sp. LCM 4579]|nr:hypothetical protein LCM4579_27715 [Ensifer sp. LCM 4579]